MRKGVAGRRASPLSPAMRVPAASRLRGALLTLIFMAAAAIPAAADPAAGKAPGKLAAGLWFDIDPLIEFSNRPKAGEGHAITMDELHRYMARPAFLSGGFLLGMGPLKAVMVLELQQDPGEYLKGGKATNLPVSSDGFAFMFSNNYPNTGFFEGAGEWWSLSAGRRPLNIGRGSLSLSLSGENPWYDHMAAGMSAPLGPGRLGYDYIAVNVQRRPPLEAKWLFVHRLAWDSPCFSIGAAEYNLVTGVKVDLQDMGPFVVFHHLFADGSNVIAELDAEFRLPGAFRAYAGMLMDDFRLSSEGSGSNPNAFGFSAGLEWAAIRGSPRAGPRYEKADFLRRTGSVPLEGGLVLSLEGWWASTYLYRRSASAPSQAYSTRYFLQTDSMGWQVADSWFAYPMGPDRILAQVKARYAKGQLSASATGRLFVLGAESGLATFSEPYAPSWLGPQAPVTLGWEAAAGASWEYGHASRAEASISFNKSGEEPGIMSFSLGFIQRLGIGETP